MFKLRTNVKCFLKRVRNEETGQGLTEYVLLFLLIVIVSIVALTFFGQQVTTELSTVATTVGNVH